MFIVTTVSARIVALTVLAAVLAAAPAPAARAAGTQIVDSKGALVGLVNRASNALRQLLDGQWVSFPVELSGLVATDALNGNSSFIVYYISINCTGTPYLDASSVPPLGVVVNPSVGSAGGIVGSGKLYYPSQPFMATPVFSAWQFGSCGFPTSQFVVAGQAASVNLSFSPPFSIK
jgi:hypothetical protein